MSLPRPLLFLALLGLSGIVAYKVATPSSPNPAPISKKTVTSDRSSGPQPRAHPAPRPLLLDEPPLQQMDPTNYGITVSDIALQDVGQKIENEARTRLQNLTSRYQLTANQRRETFPLIVSHHPDYTDGLIVNGFSSTDPGALDFETQFSEILNLSQRELFQEDLGADRAWWSDVLAQIREDLEAPLLPEDSGENNGSPVERPDLKNLLGN